MTDAIARLNLPPEWPKSLLSSIQARNRATGQRLVVLDDDPMAGQALYEVPVLTRWDAEALARELEANPVVCLLTNSRSLSEADAVALATEVGAQLSAVAFGTGHAIQVAARGDSTLRGHFPAETEALAAALHDLGEPPACCLFVPYFGGGGRYTLDDTQYVLDDGGLMPVGETEFARDPAFGFTASHLPSWVEERTKGRTRAGEVACISLSQIRGGGPDVVADRLFAARDGAIVVANAASDRDLEVIAAGVIEAELAGKRFTYRSAAPFVRVRAGLPPRPLLGPAELRSQRQATGGGLVIAGSHTDRTTAQIEVARREAGIECVELDVEALASSEANDEVMRCAGAVLAALAQPRNVLLYTSRAVQANADSRGVGERIGRALSSVVDRVPAPPKFLIVKGGATASDIALGSLGVERAEILGQLLPGVPVWRFGPECRFAGLAYVIFPGNVGRPEDLLKAIQRLDEA